MTRRALILGAVVLSGCSFTPVYGTDRVAQAYRNAVAVDAPDTPDGYALRQRLQDRLGRADSPQFRLTITLAVATEAVAIASDERATRVNLPGTASFRLLNAAGGTVTEGDVGTFTTYSSTSTTVATRAAEADAHVRLMTLLADMIVTRLFAAAAVSGG